MLTLGIESSCDETAVAIVDESGRVYSDVVHTQIAIHAEFGGVVPELASRNHLKNIGHVLKEALSQANLNLVDIDGLAVTCRPGLSGALMVGVQLAHGLRFASNKPLVGVDHLVGHLLAPFLHFDPEHHPAPEVPTFPYVALLASGGHTGLYLVRAPFAEAIEELGGTRDDAAGEAFDKLSKMLGLGYPGGPIIDRLAAEGDRKIITLSKPMLKSSSLEFSFSGLKSQAARYVELNGTPDNDDTLRNLCATYQHLIVSTLCQKLFQAAEQYEVSTVVIGGGVAANSEFRRRVQKLADKKGLTAVIPARRACTDNAAMIAYAGALRLARGDDDKDTVRLNPKTILPRVTRKGRGKRKDANSI